jgi:chitin disaccharide deacetylase
VSPSTIDNNHEGIRFFVLNADDFALSHGIDEAILTLAESGIVSSASAMVLSPLWKESAKALLRCPISRGLHLDFTSPYASESGGEASIGVFVSRSYAGALNRRGIASSIDRQLDLFEDGIGHPPDFVDGHQHVHQLPIVRETMLASLAERYGDSMRGIKMRLCTPRRWRGLEAAMVGALGGRALEKLAKAAGLQGNTDFAGVYSFGKNAQLSELWRSWLENLQGQAPMIMCHPAAATLTGLEVNDRISAARIREFKWLSSQHFAGLLGECRAAPRDWHGLGS